MATTAQDGSGLTRLPREQARLVVRTARLYHEQGLRQAQIAERLHISQTRVSRLLRQAVKLGVVRTVVTTPPTFRPDLEERLEARFGLQEAVVADADTDDGITRALGEALAGYLSATLSGGESVGLSSWSATLLAAIAQLSVPHPGVVGKVVQIVGSVGEPESQMQATRALTRFADVTGATPVLLPAPGFVESATVRDSILSEPAIATVTELWASLDTCIFGIGTSTPSPLLARSGNALPEPELRALHAQDAVGDICMRFFDARGQHISSAVNERVIGIPVETLLQTPRRIGAAGGSRKLEAVRAALAGNWMTVLVTDRRTAESLLADE
jgi:DNA-binding transcriptional regulator LsrR (DeoR family)